MIDSVDESIRLTQTQKQELYSKQHRCEASTLGCIPDCIRELQATAHGLYHDAGILPGFPDNGTLDAMPACFAFLL